MTRITMNLNGHEVSFTVKPSEYLLDTLRNHGIVSVKKGCDTSSCGVCTILVDDKPTLSCSYLSIRADQKNVKTVEGIISEVEKISALFGDEGADQCGFCNPGMAIMAYALKKNFKNPTDDDIKHYLVGNLCRCSGYQAQFLAIKKYLGDQK
jgi:aerobic carbon-monoxide dehydrogenase small subunit